MPTKVLNPHRRRKIRYTVPRRRTVDVTVEASARINIYIVDEEGLEAIRAGDRVRHAHGWSLLEQATVDATFELPFAPGEDWYLVLENSGDDSVAVHYEVSW